jgi:hypothetical protein
VYSTELNIVTVLKTLPILVKMLLVSCAILKDFLRIDESSVSASEVKGKIFATWVSQQFRHFVLYCHFSAKIHPSVVGKLRITSQKGPFGTVDDFWFYDANHCVSVLTYEAP